MLHAPAHAEAATTPAGTPRSILVLGAVSIIAGAATGGVCALFRIALEHADAWRATMIHWASGRGVLGIIAVIGTCALATAIAAALVRRFSPFAGGSGIPHVEAVLTGKLRPASILLVPVKFIGGVLAIGAGLALGREGPSVQMGASIAHAIARTLGRPPADCRVLLGAGAGAGLATAFNAPLAGSIFVLEELVRRFDTRITIATLGASAGAITVARAILGSTPDIDMGPIHAPDHAFVLLCFALGGLAGVAGVAYARTITGMLAATDRAARWSPEASAMLIGAAVGGLALASPSIVGGGDPITLQTLATPISLGTILPIFLIRFALGPLSYAARTPGGLFAPMLVIGAQIGVMFGLSASTLIPSAGASAPAFGVVGMAAFFAAVVRAPVTGIVLVTEMTGGFTLVLPMLAACFPAMLIPTLLRNAPIYESLLRRTLAGRTPVPPHSQGETTP